MLTNEQREKLAEQLKGGVQQLSSVPDSEMQQYPANIKELEIPTSQGMARVYAIEAGEVSENRPLILNFHGGGFIGKRMDRDELFCRKMANEFQALVLDVDYKLAPEFPYPVAVLECWDIVEWVWSNQKELSYNPDLVVLTGHSSGGNLVAGICMKAKAHKLFKPCCAVLDYPPLDLEKDPACKKMSICDMSPERAKMYNEKYVGEQNRKDRYVSPVYADESELEGFSPTLVITAGEDRLCEEGEEFALKLATSGVTVTVRRFTDSVHGFVINRMCEWEEATNLIFDYIKQNIMKRRGNIL